MKTSIHRERRRSSDSRHVGDRSSAAAMALRALLDQHPDALVAAIDPGPRGAFIPIPPGFPIAGHRVLTATSMLDVVVPADRVVVIEAWERSRRAAAARTPVHLVSTPDRTVTLHFIDVRAEHGVFAGIVVSGDGEPELDDPITASSLPPRIARVRKNELAVFVEVDEATTQILGWTAEQLVGRRSLEFVHPDDHERAIQSWMQMLSNPRVHQPVRLRHRRSDDTWVWMEISNHNLLDDPAVRAVPAEMIDISDEMAAHDALRAREQLLHRLTEALPIGVLQVTKDRQVVYTNDRLRGVLGVAAATTVDDQLVTIAPDDRPRLDAALAGTLDEGIDQDVEVQLRLSEPMRTRRCMLRLRALSDGEGRVTGAIVCVEDITESAELRAELEQQATRDMLTGLLNRRSAIVKLEAALAIADSPGTAVIFVDLDRFKSVNDRYGHVAGDELLRVAADRMAISVRLGDALARIGGDEFLIVCPQMPGVAEARRVALRISQALSRSVRVSGVAVDVTASVGISYTSGPISADTLVSQADAAMYEAKRRQNNRPITYRRTLARPA